MSSFPSAKEDSALFNRSYQPLDNASVQDILNYLECPTKVPTLRHLNRLIYAYICNVPWESVSRILKRHTTPETKDCPRWPDEFWRDAMRFGFGGTCFESNLAFYSLLMELGYDGYLTVNDMGTTSACHAAIIVLLNGKKYLVDITIPLHSAVQVNTHKATRRHTQFQDYTIRPVQENRYEVERSHHPHRYAFTLIDIPVHLFNYTLPNSLAGVFRMPKDQISAALSWMQKPVSEYLNNSGNHEVVIEVDSSLFEEAHHENP